VSGVRAPHILNVCRVSPGHSVADKHCTKAALLLTCCGHFKKHNIYFPYPELNLHCPTHSYSSALHSHRPDIL